MSNVNSHSMRCHHCGALFRIADDSPRAATTCPHCGRAQSMTSGNREVPPAPPVQKPGLSDDDVLEFLGVVPAARTGKTWASARADAPGIETAPSQDDQYRKGLS